MKRNKRVPNTNSEAHHTRLLAEMIVTGGLGMIERQEKQGQMDLADSCQLPLKGSEDPAFKAMGIVFGKKSDDIFIDAQLPDGWNIQPTDHSMWSDLLDAKGRQRAAIFYKAAFYDRNAHMYPISRFSIHRDYNAEDYKTNITHHVKDCGKIVFSFHKKVVPYKEPVVSGSDDIRRYYDEVDAATKIGVHECEQYLIKNGFSDFKDASKYWE